MLINCILDNLLRRVVHELTRHISLLDILLTNDEKIVSKNFVENLGVSDHNIIR